MNRLKHSNGVYFKGNLAVNWKKWKPSFEMYVITSSSTLKSAENKVAILLHIIGKAAVKQCNVFDFNDECRKRYS